MNWREDYAKEALHDGKAAYRAGETENPHAPGSLEHRAWESGWSAAQAQKYQIALLRALYPPVKAFAKAAE